jgi:hypothetical protein
VDVDLVGVGGRSSTVDWVSMRLDGETHGSSPSLLRKEFRRVNCGWFVLDPKMLTFLPNDSGEMCETRPLKGVVGLPNSCSGRESFPNADGAGESPKWMCAAFFDGVSGIFVLENSAAGGQSMLRCRLEISPVDMKA